MPNKSTAYVYFSDTSDYQSESPHMSKVLILPDGKGHLFVSFDPNGDMTAPTYIEEKFTDQAAVKAKRITLSESTAAKLRKAAELCDSLEDALRKSRRFRR